MTEDRSSPPAPGFGKIMRGVAQFGAIVATVLVIKTVAAEAYYVPSGSMLPSLLVGDYLLVSKFPYGYSRYSLPLPLAPASSQRLLGKLPERGDVVVFRLPRDPTQTYVKRAVGLPGDRVQMRNGRLWVNGKMLPLRRDGIGAIEADDGTREPAPRFLETLPNGHEHPIFKYRRDGELDDTPQFFVGEGQLFVMGDNLDDSLDSRVPVTAFGVGFVPVRLV